MKKRMLIFFIVLLVNTTYSQQPYFNERYNTDVYEVAWNVLENDSGYLIVGGTSEVSLFYKIALIFMDFQGNIIEKKSYGKSLTRYYAGGPGSFIKISDGGYAMAGSYEDTAETGDVVLYRFNSKGDTLWTREYGDTSQQGGIQCKQTPDNGFIIIGFTVTTDYPDGDFWLIKTDSLGNVQWDTTYGGQYFEYGSSVDVCSDGGYIMVGETGSYGINAGPFSQNATNIYIVKADSMGNEEWTKVFGDSFVEAVWNVEHTSDGGYIIGGGLTDSAPGGYPYSRPYLIKLDSAGNTEWEKTYGPVRFQTTLRMVRELPDGSFIACGHTSDSIGFHGMGLVLKVAANGDSIWYRTHEILSGSSSQNFLYDIRSTSDNGFIAAGWLAPSSPDTGGQDMWVMKLDSCGCLVPYCDLACSGDTTGAEEFQISDLRFQIYPNPTEGKFTIQIFNETGGGESVEITVYDILGRKISNMKTGAKQLESDSYRMDISKHPAGVYLIQVWFGGAHHKWSENNYYSARVVKY